MERNYGGLSGAIVIAGIVILVLLFTIKLFNISYPVTITNQPVQELSVVGEGKVDAVPDTASVSLGITAEDTTVAEVQTKMNATNNNILAALTKLGIYKKDITTSSYSINPAYDYTRGQTITGYSSNATITVKTQKTDQLPSIISAATEAGANQVFGTNYSIENPDKFREQARNEAIANAKTQAKKLADQLGIKLGKVTNIIESTSDGGTPIPYMYKEQALDSRSAVVNPAPQLEAGSQTITSTVTLFFEKN